MSSKLMWLLMIVLGIGMLAVVTESLSRENGRTSSAKPASARNWTEASLVLEKLVKTHPHEDVRVKLNRLVEDNVVFLNFQEGIGMGGEGLATVTYVRTPTHGTVLTLSIGLSELYNKATSKVYKQLVIYHEYIHIDQQLEKRYPGLAITRRADIPFTEKEIRLHFASEVEAYEGECKLAVKLDAAHEIDICQAYAEGGLRKMKILLAARLAQTTMYAMHNHGPFLKKIARE